MPKPVLAVGYGRLAILFFMFIYVIVFYTVAGRAISFALEQPLHVVALACLVSGILK
jgi:hypothetical protein